MSCREIGGYFGLECSNSSLYHKEGIMLNSGRNALRYIIRAYDIKKIAIPYYTCPVILDAIKLERCEVSFYEIDNNLSPILFGFSEDDFIVYNNYFGVCSNIVTELSKKYKNLIVDNAQGFYLENLGIASFYSPRKFFGVSDGGIVVSKQKLDYDFEKDISYNRSSHLLKRLDVNAGFGYKDFCENEEHLDNRSIKYISNLTEAIMGNIDYERCKNTRLENFVFLHSKIEEKNKLIINLSKKDVPMVYPLLSEDSTLRDRLIKNKIYVAKYWPDLEKYCPTTSYSLYLRDNLIPLPIDQRYGIQDMQRILEVING